MRVPQTFGHQYQTTDDVRNNFFDSATHLPVASGTSCDTNLLCDILIYECYNCVS